MSVTQTMRHSLAQQRQILVPTKYEGALIPTHPIYWTEEKEPPFTPDQILEVYKHQSTGQDWVFISGFQQNNLLFKGSVDVPFNKRKSARYLVIACIPMTHPVFNTKKESTTIYSTASAPYVTFSFERMV